MAERKERILQGAGWPHTEALRTNVQEIACHLSGPSFLGTESSSSGCLRRALVKWEVVTNWPSKLASFPLLYQIPEMTAYEDKNVPFDGHFTELHFGPIEKQHSMPGSMRRQNISYLYPMTRRKRPEASAAKSLIRRACSPMTPRPPSRTHLFSVSSFANRKAPGTQASTLGSLETVPHMNYSTK